MYDLKEKIGRKVTVFFAFMQIFLTFRKVRLSLTPEFSSMMPVDEQVVVCYGVRHEIIAYYGCGLNPNLCTAKVLLVLATGEFNIDRQQTFHIIAEFDQGIVTGREIPMDGDADTGLEMRGVFVFLSHAQRNSTMS